MDLTVVIAELSFELENLDHVILSLEKLAEIRRRRTGAERRFAAVSASQESAGGNLERMAVSARQRES